MLIHTTRASGLTVAALMDHWSTVPRAPRPRSAANPISLGSRSRRRARPDGRCALRSSSPTAGRASGPSQRYATKSTRRSGRRADRLGRTSPGAARVSRRVLAGRGHRDRRRRGAPAGGPLRAISYVQAGARGEQRPIPAKGLTGPGYDGHTFWDTEAFVLPLLMLTYSRRQAVADALRWRHQTLDLARERARALGLRGAAFPWRTIAGQECSGYWPAGAAAFHINAAIANAVERYLLLTGDETFAREAGVELLVETARLWRSLGHHDPAGGSGSTGSRGRTSTARSSTTTSTRT